MMTKQETLYRGASQAAWGYLFLYLDINIGSVSILPRFVGYLLFLSAIRYLSAERQNLALLRPLAILLALWNTACWLASWLGITLSEQLPPLDLIASVASLYFQFQFLTDCAALAAAYQPPGDVLDQRLLRWRTVQTVLITITELTYCLSEFWASVWALVTIVLVLVSAVLALCLMVALFSLRKLFA